MKEYEFAYLKFYFSAQQSIAVVYQESSWVWTFSILYIETFE